MMIVLMKMRLFLAEATGIDLPILDELAHKGGTVISYKTVHSNV